jgi:hypothetical protein
MNDTPSMWLHKDHYLSMTVDERHSNYMIVPKCRNRHNKMRRHPNIHTQTRTYTHIQTDIQNTDRTQDTPKGTIRTSPENTNIRHKHNKDQLTNTNQQPLPTTTPYDHGGQQLTTWWTLCEQLADTWTPSRAHKCTDWRNTSKPTTLGQLMTRPARSEHVWTRALTSPWRTPMRGGSRAAGQPKLNSQSHQLRQQRLRTWLLAECGHFSNSVKRL